MPTRRDSRKKLAANRSNSPQAGFRIKRSSDLKRILKAALAQIPNVNAEPAPDVEIVDFNERGPVLAVRPYTHTNHYWQVYFDTNRAITQAFGAAGYPVPEAHMVVRQKAP